MFEKRSETCPTACRCRDRKNRRSGRPTGDNATRAHRIIAWLKRRFGGRLFERLPAGVYLTPLGVTVTERAQYPA